MSTDFSGRTALVTGAARGIGLAIAEMLLRRGARVALIDVDAAALESACAGLRREYQAGKLLPLAVDVTNGDDVRSAVENTVSTFGSLEILVNNAGICPLTPFDQVSESEWNRVLAVNLKGAFLFCQKALPALRLAGTRGRIVNVTSVAGQMGGVLVGAHYAASKAGLIGLTRSLARLLAADGVTANCVAPATTSTDLTAGWADDLQSRVKAQIPLGRFGEPEEIAAAVCFLAGDEAGFITGATLDVNGGLYLR